MDPATRMEHMPVNAAGAPSNPPPPPPPPENNRMQVAVLNVMDLPLKKRILMILRAEAENEDLQFACNICGRRFGTGRALAGHRAHHRVGPSEKKRPRGAVVVYSGSHQCVWCGRMFGSARGLGAHKRFCKGRHSFDLNELPPPPPPPAAVEERMFSLPWF